MNLSAAVTAVAAQCIRGRDAGLAPDGSRASRSNQLCLLNRGYLSQVTHFRSDMRSRRARCRIPLLSLAAMTFQAGRVALLVLALVWCVAAGAVGCFGYANDRDECMARATVCQQCQWHPGDGNMCEGMPTCTAPDDGNACTSDVCREPDGCDNYPITCDDGDQCTIDACDAVSGCVYQPIECDDSNPCTDDSCFFGDCQFDNNNNNLCDDGDACTIDDFCRDGVCSFTLVVECEEGYSCQAGECVQDKVPPAPQAGSPLAGAGTLVAIIAVVAALGGTAVVTVTVRRTMAARRMTGASVLSGDAGNNDSKMLTKGSRMTGASFLSADNTAAMTGAAIESGDGVMDFESTGSRGSAARSRGRSRGTSGARSSGARSSGARSGGSGGRSRSRGSSGARRRTGSRGKR